MRVVILGCGGYIGHHLLARMLADGGYEIDGWDLSAAKIEEFLPDDRFRFHRADVGSAESQQQLARTVPRADVVINLAAICNPAEYNTQPLRVIKANFMDLHPVVATCADAGIWLIHLSTSEVYGRTISSYHSPSGDPSPSLYELDEATTPLVMGPVLNQRWTYACAKQLIERLVYAYHREQGLPFTIIRPLNFFGPRMDYVPGYDGEGTPRVLASFMGALIDGRPLPLVDGGQARRTILSVYDGIDAMIAMLDQPHLSQGQFYNLGNPDSEVTIAELAELMREVYADITGDEAYRRHPIVSVPSEDFYGPGYEDCDRRMPRIDNARRLGWAPRRALRQTLAEAMLDYHLRYATGSRRETDSLVEAV